MWAIDEGEWPVSRPCRFIPGERTFGTHWTGGSVGPGTCIGRYEKEKYFLPLPGREQSFPGRPTLNLVDIQTQLSGLL
jgi:hypothetical protein